MSYHVDPKTLLFDDLTTLDALKLEDICYDIVIVGQAHTDCEAFIQWAKTADYDERQRLLVHATAFPQRALLSIAKFWRAERAKMIGPERQQALKQPDPEKAK